MFRFEFDEVDKAEAAEILDRDNIPYENDSYGRIMVSGTYVREAVKAWDNEYLDYNEI